MVILGHGINRVSNGGAVSSDSSGGLFDVLSHLSEGEGSELLVNGPNVSDLAEGGSVFDGEQGVNVLSHPSESTFRLDHADE